MAPPLELVGRVVPVVPPLEGLCGAPPLEVFPGNQYWGAHVMVIYMHGPWLSVGAKTWGRYVPCGMWKWVFVPLNGSVGPLAW